VALSESPASAAWLAAPQTLESLTALDGTPSAASWQITEYVLAEGVLSGEAAASTWNVEAEDLTPESFALTGDAAGSTWVVPSPHTFGAKLRVDHVAAAPRIDTVNAAGRGDIIPAAPRTDIVGAVLRAETVEATTRLDTVDLPTRLGVVPIP
jgi:hypothetical protein